MNANIRRGMTSIGLPAAVLHIFGLLMGSALAADFSVTNEASLRTALTDAASGDTITFNANVTLTADLPAITTSVTINGNGDALDGAGQFRGLFAYSGNSTISGLTIRNTLAKGGDGGSTAVGYAGGGGMGAGGALFVAAGANVTINDVTFLNNTAQGGAGGTGNASSATFVTAGGGGLGGDGGAVVNMHSGGGGGIGRGANGATDTQAAGAGIVTGAAAGTDGNNATNPTGGANGGGGGAGGGIAGSGGIGAVTTATTSAGGFGGGGGGTNTGPNTSAGGFGGGGGAANISGSGGFGGGAGGGCHNPGGFGGGGTALDTNKSSCLQNRSGDASGGAGFGGAIFVMQGGTLSITGTFSQSGGQVVAGTGANDLLLDGVTPARLAGQAGGTGVFLQGKGNLTLTTAAGQTQTLSTQLMDQVGFVNATPGYSPATCKQFPGLSSCYAGTEKWSLAVTGGGILVLSGANAYSGGTTVAGSTLSISAENNIGPGPLALLNGATVAFTSSFTFDHPLTVAGDPTFDVAPGVTTTISSVIADGAMPGEVVKTDTGTLVLTANSSYTGPTTVAAGTLRTGVANALPSSSAVTVAAGATFDLNSFDQGIGSLAGAGLVTLGSATLTTGNDNTSTSFSGGISGAGGLTKVGAGTLALSGASSYSGGTMLNAGTLGLGNSSALGTGPLTMRDGTVLQFAASGLNLANAIVFPGIDPVIDTQGNSDTISGVISGTGGITKIGSGSLDLTASNTYTGATTVSAGTLVVDGSIASSAVTVANGAVLGGKGTVGGLVAQSGSTVAPGAVTPFTTLDASANVSFAPGSTFLVNVNPAGRNDKLVAGGTATLQGGTVQVLAGNGAYSPLSRYTILTAAGGVSGTFAQLSISSNLALAFAFLTPSLSYDSNDVYLGFAQSASFASAAVTRNQAATSAAVQALGLGNSLYDAVVSQSFVGARQAFDALSGEIHASAVTAAFEDSRLPRDAILDRLSQHEAPVLGTATTMTGAYAADLPSRKGPALAPVEVRMYQPHLFDLWGQGFGNWGTTGSDNNAAKLTRDTGGFIIGADTTLSTGWSGVWRLGVAGGYTDDSLKVANRLSSGDYQSIFGAVYGGTSYGAFDLKLGATAASTHTHTSRSISFPMFSGAASSSYGGYAVQGFAEAGYRLPFHWSLWSYVPGLESLSVTYEPFLQAAIIHIGQDRYAETAFAAGFGGAAGLVGSAHDYDLGSTTLGLRSEYKLASLPGFTLRTLIGWRYAYGDVKPKVTQAFAGSFGSFTVAGVPVDRNALVTETNLDYAVSSAVTLGVSYSGQFGQHATDNAFKGHLDVSF